MAAMAKAEALQRLEAHLEKHGFDDIDGYDFGTVTPPTDRGRQRGLILVLKRTAGRN